MEEEIKTDEQEEKQEWEKLESRREGGREKTRRIYFCT
jgi:hypothetical protein